MTIDFDNLPPPAVVEALSFEAVLAAMKADLVTRLPEIAPTLQLESAVVNKVLQVCAYRETLLRSRINDAARANLLAFAKGSDLDHLGIFYDAFRMAGESDERYLTRIILAIQGRSPGGTEPRYRFIAMTADIRVQGAIVYRVGKSPVVHVAVISNSPDGVASADLLAKVDAALQNPEKRMVNDTIIVASAVQRVINIEADIWLLPEASADTIAAAEANLRAAWVRARALGRDFAVSWWVSKLIIEGVQKAAPISPLTDEVVIPSEAISIGTVTLNNRGRAY